MSRGWGWSWMMGALAIALQGCWVSPPPRQGPPPVADEEHLDWAEGEPYFIVVRTACRTLDVYRHGDRVRSYPAVFGLGGRKGKLHEGDHRTPTGLYAIVGMRRHPRWQRFMLLDYPNLHDAERYEVALESGRIPMLGTHPVGLGGAVGIHGVKRGWGFLGRWHRLFDWTNGCIAVADHEIEELWELVPLGTPVRILP